MDLALSDKTALVTGASAGLSRAIAKGLAAEGVTICATSRRLDLLASLAEEIVAAGGRPPVLIAADITAEGAPVAIAGEALEKLGRIDIVVNSAGASGGATPLQGADAEWAGIMRLDFTAIRELTHALLPAMMSHGWGRVINVSGKSEIDRLGTAASAKAALHAWSKGLSMEVGKHGITVNCLAPGRILSEQILRKYTPEFRAKEGAEKIPVGRYGTAEEFANVAVFLASAAASYVTGVVLPVDGGFRRYIF